MLPRPRTRQRKYERKHRRQRRRKPHDHQQGRQSPYLELAVATNVEEACLVGHPHGDGAQHQRDSLCERKTEVVRSACSSLNHPSDDRARVIASPGKTRDDQAHTQDESKDLKSDLLEEVNDGGLSAPRV